MDKKSIGQLFVIGYQGDEPSDEFLDFVKEWGIGGVIVFARNLSRPEKLPECLKKIKEASGQEVFAAIDQEGGLVLRILEGGSLFPSAMGLAACKDETLAESTYEAIGKEMLSLGLNWNLAPVLDINHSDNPGIGARSFGDTPELVSKFGTAAIKGLQKTGVLACAKHFPGKGHAKVDSHLTLPTIPYDKKRLESFELAPFKAAIQEKVAAIMTAHVFFPAYESSSDLPATLSESVLTKLLRDELKYEGLLITDDLEMGAITEKYGIADAAAKSFLAGADLLLICHQLSEQKKAADTILNLVKTNKKAQTRLAESMKRIKTARDKMSETCVGFNASLKQLKEEHKTLIEKVYDHSILFARYSPNVFPFKATEPILFFCPEIASLVQVEESHCNGGIQDQISKVFPNAVCFSYNPKSACEEILKDFYSFKDNKSLPENTKALFFSYNGHLFRGQIDAAKKVHSLFPELILAALRNPFDISYAPEIKTSCATFGFRSPAIDALLKVLTGKVQPTTTGWPSKI